MLFPTYLFVFVFLPAVLASVWLVARLGRKDLQPLMLLLASVLFYLLPNWRHGHIIVSSVVINYLIGRWMVGRPLFTSRVLLFAGVSYNLAVIAYYKYSNFFGEVYSQLSGAPNGWAKIVLPVGISFYTFQQIAYLVDRHRGRNDSWSYGLIDYGLFVTFFPQLIAGPIVHHQEIMPQIETMKERRFNPIWFNAGVGFFILGLFKKLVVADNLARMADPIFQSADASMAVDCASAWVATAAYTLQIYFDFSAYSDMAIGIGLLFGLKLPINFLSPYKSKSIVEFWRRWHITLSRFLRDYLYIPLGGNRCGKVRRYVNLMLTMLLGGLWHGAGWNFVIWGGLHGVYLAINHFTSAASRSLKFSVPAFLAAPATLLAVMLAWVFFRAETHQGAATMLSAMAGAGGTAATRTWSPIELLFLAASWLVVFLSPNVAELYEYHGVETDEAWSPKLVSPGRLIARVWPIVLGLAFAAALAYMPEPVVFIYFNF